MLSDKQKQEVDKAIYQQVQENLDDLSVLEDYWHGITCSDGTVLDINIYDSADAYGTPNETGLRCTVYFADKDMNIDYSKWVDFESKSLNSIQPLTNAQLEVHFREGTLKQFIKGEI